MIVREGAAEPGRDLRDLLVVVVDRLAARPVALQGEVSERYAAGAPETEVDPAGRHGRQDLEDLGDLQRAVVVEQHGPRTHPDGAGQRGDAGDEDLGSDAG